MPLLDSFTVDHTRMEAPAVRVAKTMNTPHGDAITVFDLNKKLKTVTELNLSSSTTAPKAIVLEDFTFVDSRFKSH